MTELQGASNKALCAALGKSKDLTRGLTSGPQKCRVWLHAATIKVQITFKESHEAAVGHLPIKNQGDQ